MDDPRAVIGCLCETCGCPVQVCTHPGTGDEELFCVTCDIFVHIDRVVAPWCPTTQRAPDGEHFQHCGEVVGHEGPHRWSCDHPAPDGHGACCLDAADPHVEGHEYEEPFDDEPCCEALVRTWPHGIMFRCRGQLGHDGAHVADVHYFFDGYLDGYTASWVRSDRFVEHVPNEEGVRYVLADEPPVTCGRCAGARSLLGTVDIGVTSWRCASCDETQFDVHCNEDEEGTLTWIESIESVESAHDENA